MTIFEASLLSSAEKYNIKQRQCYYYHHHHHHCNVRLFFMWTWVSWLCPSIFIHPFLESLWFGDMWHRITDQMPFLTTNQQCKSTDSNHSISHSFLDSLLDSCGKRVLLFLCWLSKAHTLNQKRVEIFPKYFPNWTYHTWIMCKSINQNCQNSINSRS